MKRGHRALSVFTSISTTVAVAVPTPTSTATATATATATCEGRPRGRGGSHQRGGHRQPAAQPPERRQLRLQLRHLRAAQVSGVAVAVVSLAGERECGCGCGPGCRPDTITVAFAFVAVAPSCCGGVARWGTGTRIAAGVARRGSVLGELRGVAQALQQLGPRGVPLAAGS